MRFSKTAYEIRVWMMFYMLRDGKMPVKLQRQLPGAPLLTWIKFDPNMGMYRYISIIKFGMKSIIHSQTSRVHPLESGNGWLISTHTLLGMWLLIYAGI